MIEDHHLLRRYVEEKSQDAFAELVRRRIGLVYAVAVRQCGGDVHLAEDVTQKVFADLARKAGALGERPVVSGWLYRSAQFAASDIVRSERRRRAREEATQFMNETWTGTGEGTADWEKLRPVIDEAMAELGEEDRDAVALRFFEEKSYAEIGRRLVLSEDAARKRVSRAVEKLHGLLARRGVKSTETALALVLAQQAAAAVPAGLAASVTSGALAGAGAVGGGAALFMGTTKMTAGLIGAAAAIGVGLAVLGAGRGSAARAELAVAQREEAALGAKLKELEGRVQSEAKRVQTAEAENARLLAVAEKIKTSPPVAEPERVTSGIVMERWRRAQQLAKDGDPVEALRELLWCYDVGMVQISSMSAVRSSSGVSTLARLAERYPPAIDALRERRDKAREKMMADASDFQAVSEFGSINRALKDDAANIALFDQLPAGDRRRTSLAGSSYDYLVQQQRYADAIEGRSFSLISSVFESMLGQRPAAGLPNPEEIEKRQRDSLIASTTRSIEALAGAGDLANARALAQRLLAYDNTEATLALIQQHAERARQPGLMTAETVKRGH